MATSLNPNFDKNVFINCPFDDEYTELLQPLLFTVIYLGFNPRIATERSNSAEQRIAKICEFIGESKYSIHDLSRLQAKKVKEYYRLNMPFELGIDYGFRHIDGSHLNEKQFLVVAEKRFDYAKAISDLSGVDIRSHKNDPKEFVSVIRNWFSPFLVKLPQPPSKIWESFNYFITDFKTQRESEGFSLEDIYSMPISEFMSYIKGWLDQESS
jgi:hypothetical protein